MKPTYPAKYEPLLSRIEEAKAAGLYFYNRPLESVQDAKVWVKGQPMMMLASNNYLGLINHPRVKRAAIDAVNQMGTGVSGSRTINGNTWLHEELERKLAAFKGTEAAIVFSTGYQTNLGVISAMVSNGDVAIVDKFDHASIIDGCKLSGADIRIFPHNDMAKLERILQESTGYETKLIIVDSVYSMDGDLADLPAICELAEKYDAFFMVDEAHATGVLGEHGRGAVEHFGLEGKVDLIMGTMSKSLASVGGFVCGSKALIEILRHTARSYIFSAALPPSVVATAIAAIEVIQEEPSLRERLWANTTRFKAGLDQLGFNTMNSVTPIIPILIGDDMKTLHITRMLEESGLFVCGIIYPAVPRGGARLRTHVSAAHSSADIEGALEIFGKVGERLGVI